MDILHHPKIKGTLNLLGNPRKFSKVYFSGIVIANFVLYLAFGGNLINYVYFTFSAMIMAACTMYFCAGIATLTWIPCKAMILDYKTVESNVSDDDTTYGVSVTYIYEIKGKKYKCDVKSYKFDKSYKRREDAQEEFREYPLFEEITVYYNPDNPEQAVITKGYPLTNLFVIAVSLVFMAVGILIIVEQ